MAKKNGPWQISVQSELREYGWGEDEMRYCEVYFLVATNPQGFRYIGFILGNSRDNNVEKMKQAADNFNTTNFDPINDPCWQPWFPCYGSEAYESSNQNESDIDAEKRGTDYYPA